jgi:hypothetical protein
VFPKEMPNGRPPRSWAERDYDLVHWSVMSRGGHFACLEQPDFSCTTSANSSAHYARRTPGLIARQMSASNGRGTTAASGAPTQ